MSTAMAALTWPIGEGYITLWLNRSGRSFADPVVIRGTPSISDADAVRLVDLLGAWHPGHPPELRGRLFNGASQLAGSDGLIDTGTGALSVSNNSVIFTRRQPWCRLACCSESNGDVEAAARRARGAGEDGMARSRLVNKRRENKQEFVDIQLR